MERFEGINDCLDAEPDQFSFNFGGYTGQFAFNWGNSTNAKRSHCVNCSRKLKGRSDCSIAATAATVALFRDLILLTEDGTLYEFKAKGNHRYTQQVIIPVRRCNYINPAGELIVPVSSWYLTRIISPKGNTVNFEYTPYNLSIQSARCRSL